MIEFGTGDLYENFEMSIFAACVLPQEVMPESRALVKPGKKGEKITSVFMQKTAGQNYSRRELL